jgi:hypothetical protein
MKTYSIILKLYPNVAYVNIKGAFDSEGNIVEIDDNLVQQEYAKIEYVDKRAKEYPNLLDYIDGVVKGDQEQIDAYIAACQAVKTKYPKPE